MAKWVVLGAAALDTIVQVPRLPQPDEIVFPISAAQYPGGSAANIAVGLSRLGESVSFLGKVGDDDAGRRILQSFREDGVDTAGVRIKKGCRSGGAFIAVDADGERVIYSLGGDVLYETPSMLDPSAFEGIGGLYIGEAFPEVGLEAAKLAHARGAECFFGPGGLLCGYGLAHLSGLVAASDYLLVNLPEALALSGCTDKAHAVRRLLETGAGAVLLTEGKDGASLFSGEQAFHCPAFRVRAVDTTGAGDAFTAGFLHASAAEMDLDARLRFASACAAEAIQTVGARSSMPTAERMETIWRERNERPD